MAGSTSTPRRFFHSIGHTITQIMCKLKFYDSDTDTFEVFDGTNDGKDISSLSIVPWLWFDMPYFEAVLFSPYYTE